MKEEIKKIIENLTEKEIVKGINWEEKFINIKFPDLQGSEKQVKWANDIKNKNAKIMIARARVDYTWVTEAAEGSRRYEDFMKRYENKVDEIEKYINETSAKVIIETR